MGRTLIRSLLLLALVACSKPSVSSRAAAMAHGGLGSPPGRSDGPGRAVDAALAKLEAGADPIDAAVAGVLILEDDERFNAGTGARVRLDGETVQMDASLMRSDGKFAAVAAIERVKNPVLVARAVMDTPHLLLVGDGATRFARTLGMPDYDPATPAAREKTAKIQQQLLAKDPSLPADWKTFDWRRHWNFEKPMAETGLAGGPVDKGSDTVGVVVRTTDGRFAVALSTGGTTITLRGRVGDVPIYGCGLFAGPSGASAATGDGEKIIEAGLARQIDEWLRDGVTPEEVALRAKALVEEKKGEVGVLVLGTGGMAVAASKPMAWAARVSGSSSWMGPSPSPD